MSRWGWYTNCGPAWDTYLPKQINDYQRAKSIYESIKVLSGTRRDKSLNIRPIGKRAYWYDRIWQNVKGKTVASYSVGIWWGKDPSPYVTWYPRHVTIHVAMWLRQPHTRTIMNAVLPAGLSLDHRRSKTYVLANKKYYLLEKKDLRFRMVSGIWEVFKQDVVQEYEYKIDQTATKVLRKKLKPFIDYAGTIIPLLQPEQNGYGGYSSQYMHHNPMALRPERWSKWVGGKLNSNWYQMAVHYKMRCGQVRYYWNATPGGKYIWQEPTMEQVWRTLYADVIKKAMPFKKTLVPIGKTCTSSYDSIVRANGAL